MYISRALQPSTTANQFHFVLYGIIKYKLFLLNLNYVVLDQCEKLALPGMRSQPRRSSIFNSILNGVGLE
jgi:hypothetical protein